MTVYDRRYFDAVPEPDLLAVRIMPTRLDPVLPLSKHSNGPAARIVWILLQSVLLAVGVAVAGLLLFMPAVGVYVFWKVVIPVAPALVALAPGLWRNICPMCTMHMLPQKFGMARNWKMSATATTRIAFLAVFLLFLIVPLRHLGLNVDGWLTAGMVVIATVVSMIMGALYEKRSGWCVSLCPIHPVERLYANTPIVSVKNARCNVCEGCCSPCPDSTTDPMSANIESTPPRRFLENLMAGSFCGFIWGWFQVKDVLPGEVGFSQILNAYAWPLGAGLLTYAVFNILKLILPVMMPRYREEVQTYLRRIFAATAISTYYWYYRPPGSEWLPPSFPDVAIYLHVAAAALFFYIMVLRSPSRSWTTRPVLSSTYWPTRFDSRTNAIAVRVTPKRDQDND
ncbi:MAG: ferredoxin [Alphaproteobacteria bacterium]|nr:ferredoxin [Alphaproteobacteria bacterium]